MYYIYVIHLIRSCDLERDEGEQRNVDACAHAHMHVRTHTHTHEHTHTLSHTHAHTHINIHTRSARHNGRKLYIQRGMYVCWRGLYVVLPSSSIVSTDTINIYIYIVADQWVLKRR